ncbi:MAG: DUF4160 domain-containing protein [Candidatus Margulisbacteria bacterium]|nr:DUF4160 domain-containing protein [Candidatus Margulisiibacteriota bacterium]MBU1616445.1 DUF4160 domain-containing protein [Candidatus Margulisiibacteriota bacterium]
MPEISRFFGIVIAVFYDDHNPPHFHARYEGNKAVIDINELKITEGSLPPRALGFVIEWALTHKQELLKNWELAGEHKALLPIEPLK